MPSDESAAYYRQRWQAALKLSQAASNPGIQRIHLEFARRYAGLAGAPAPLNITKEDL